MNSFRMSFWMVPDSSARGTPCSSPATMKLARIGITAPFIVIDTDISARLDRLPFGRFHTLVIVALGITWVLDGLEVTLAGSLPQFQPYARLAQDDLDDCERELRRDLALR